MVALGLLFFMGSFSNTMHIGVDFVNCLEWRDVEKTKTVKSFFFFFYGVFKMGLGC